MNIGRVTPHSVTGVTLAQTIALLPPSVVMALQEGGAYGQLLSASLVAALFWEGLFTTTRGRIASFHGVTTALIFAALAPPDIAMWQTILAVSLGVVLAELVFGGRGFGFVSASTVALGLLLFSFPDIQLPVPDARFALSTLPGAIVLLTIGLMSWRVVIATGFGVVATLWLSEHSVDPTAWATVVAFGLIFLVCEPTAAASTNAGRWVYGALVGVWIVVFSGQASVTVDATVFACLMGSVFAPTIDRIVIAVHTRRRGWHHA